MAYLTSNNFSEIWKYFTGDNDKASFLLIREVQNEKLTSWAGYKSMYKHGLDNPSRILADDRYAIYCWILFGMQKNVRATFSWLNKLILREWAGEEYLKVLNAIHIKTATELQEKMFPKDQTNFESEFNAKIEPLVDMPLFSTKMIETYRATVEEQLIKLGILKLLHNPKVLA